MNPGSIPAAEIDCQNEPSSPADWSRGHQIWGCSGVAFSIQTGKTPFNPANENSMQAIENPG
jgi:hypothetical protein